MTKKILLLILMLLILISMLLNVFMVAILLRLQPTKAQEYIVEEFTIADYTWEIENFPTYGKLEAVEDVEDAAQKGMDLWVKHLTINEENVQYDPINGEPVIVAYDKESSCWLIKGTLPYGVTGAVPTAIIASDGEIIAVWMS